MDEDLPPLISENEAKDTYANEEDDIKEEKEPPCHEDPTRDSEGNPLMPTQTVRMVNPNKERGMGFTMVIQVNLG